MYGYYIHDCKCIIFGIHIYNMTKIFKTPKDTLKQKEKEKEKAFDDKEGEKPMEIEQEISTI